MNKKRELNLRKTAVFTIVINSLQILAAVGAVLLSLFTHGQAFTGRAEMVLLSAMSIVVCWGALLDIREAFQVRNVGAEADSLEDALSQLETQQATLRAQRHDFMNHLQVVFSLLEMEEYGEASAYIEKVYGDIQRVNRSLKTAHPAINALIAAKMSDCEQRGITMELNIGSPWQGLHLPSWEVCRILGNLIDNAMDALGDTITPWICVELSEDLHCFSLRVSNNGPMINPDIREKIFASGFSTKSSGRGMGLSIVESLSRKYDGTLSLDSNPKQTCFSIVWPKPAVVEKRS